jgi:hypothetical protein
MGAPVKFREIPEPCLSARGVPTHLGRSTGASVQESLGQEEKKGIVEAARAIYQTYSMAVKARAEKGMVNAFSTEFIIIFILSLLNGTKEQQC